MYEQQQQQQQQPADILNMQLRQQVEEVDPGLADALDNLEESYTLLETNDFGQVQHNVGMDIVRQKYPEIYKNIERQIPLNDFTRSGKHIVAKAQFGNESIYWLVDENQSVYLMLQVLPLGANSTYYHKTTYRNGNIPNIGRLKHGSGLPPPNYSTKINKPILHSENFDTEIFNFYAELEMATAKTKCFVRGKGNRTIDADVYFNHLSGSIFFVQEEKGYYVFSSTHETNNKAILNSIGYGYGLFPWSNWLKSIAIAAMKQTKPLSKTKQHGADIANAVLSTSVAPQTETSSKELKNKKKQMEQEAAHIAEVTTLRAKSSYGGYMREPYYGGYSTSLAFEEPIEYNSGTTWLIFK
jgi:hypothetical protein